MRKNYCLSILVLFLSCYLRAQNTGEVVPTIKAEMDVNDLGGLDYIVPIEVFKGVNKFQPNLALIYNSQGGNGMAGWGWNIAGLSVISQGGKSQAVDGITIGPQFNADDPFYLDGQRLLKVSATEYVTEQYSKIKITRHPSGGDFSFTIQYTDGRVAKYKEIYSGQHYISELIDALDNEIHYDYGYSFNVVYLRSIGYGGDSLSMDTFKINFIYKNRTLPQFSYRNGLTYRNISVLSEIKVSSTYLTGNNGLYRKYALFHDLIQNNTVERLTKIEVENEFGEKLKPLQFNYTSTTNFQANLTRSPIVHPNLITKGLGNVAVGDFHGMGRPYPIYETKISDTQYQLWDPKIGPSGAAYSGSKQLYTVKSLFNNKISEVDNLLTMTVSYSASNSDLHTLNFSDRKYFRSKSATYTLPAMHLNNRPHPVLNNYYLTPDGSLSQSPTYRSEQRQNIISDFNNDGLSDILILQAAANGLPAKIFFAEIGKLSGTIVPTEIISPQYGYSEGSKIYTLEFDGDGVPEILTINPSGEFKVFNLNLSSNALEQITTISPQPLTSYTGKTPLIFGDFNGDGLTDFITPNKVYNIEGSTSGKELKKMESEPQIWTEYISTGKNFLRYQKDFTEQKLAYIIPSQRNIINKSSGWEKFWSGTPDSYSYTEYGTSTILASDINNDGKSDLISIKKFGKVKYNEQIWRSTIESQNVFTIFTPPLDVETYFPTTANKIYYHINKPLANGQHTFENSSTIQPITNTPISPLSLVLCNTDYNSLNKYKTEVVIHDPLARLDFKLSINDDASFAGLLQSIDNGSPVVQKIEYRPMVEKNNNNTEEVYTTTDLNLDYPFHIHKNIGLQYLVYKIHTEFNNKVLTTEYRYQNGIQHLGGKGFMGFQKTFVSDPYESVNTDGKYRIKELFKGLYWTVNTHDPLLYNALSSTTYGSLDAASIFKKTTFINARFNKNNSYLILATVEQAKDYLKNITTTKSYTYDTAGDLLLKQTATNYNNVGSKLVKFDYQPEFTTGQHYFFGKIRGVENTAYKDGLSFSTKEEQSYNSNGTILQQKKFGNNTPPIITDFTYYPYGEVKTCTLTTEGIAPLVTHYQYDATKRYVALTTTPEGVETITNYSPLGRLLSEQSFLGHVTTYGYDNWGNLNLITDFLGKKTFITKNSASSGAPGSYEVRKTTEGGVEIIETFDMFDRLTESRTKGINDQWVTVRTEYDIFGRLTKKSEPFFEGDDIKWNLTEYDELNRPIKNTTFNGRVAITCYEGLKVTVEDGHRKTSQWLDAMGNVVKHQDPGGIIIYKYYPNGTLKEADYEGIKTKIEIDGWGNKKKLTEPSAGTYEYLYDNLSRIKKEINPKGGITEYIYNDSGKLEAETVTSPTENTAILKNYSYDPQTKLPTVISGTYNGRAYSYTTYYNDPYYRVTGHKEETPEFKYETSVTYDLFGRTELTEMKVTLNSPNHISTSQIKNIYNANGILVKQLDNITGGTIWELNSVNPYGSSTRMTYGNGYTLDTSYNAGTMALENINHYNDSGSVINIDYTYDVQRGLLLNRNNHIFNKEEVYQYDDVDRLLNEAVNNVVTQSYTYDKRGRMTSSSAMGKYTYDDQSYKLENLQFNGNGSSVNTQRGFASVTYNSFKSPNEIVLSNKDRISYDYSILKSRSVSYYGSLSTVATERPNRKFYSADNKIEIVKEGENIKVITYVNGDPYSSNYIKIDALTGGSLASSNNYFLHRDQQSTILAITKANALGSIVEKRYFDAWGNLKGAIIGTSTNIQQPNTMGWTNGLLIDRGYTGHEHLKTVGLIHMNGRIYDPLLRRFMSPDNYVQDVNNTQNFNRYSYVLNNPLIYVDQNGEEITFLAAVGIAVAVAIIVNGISNISNDIPFWYGAGKAGLLGGISGAISFGIGSVATSAFTSTLNQALLQAGLHATTAGAMAALGGGKFWSGFASGMISSLIGSGIQGLGVTDGMTNNFGNSDLYEAVTVASGGVGGGISSCIAGGNFWDGAKQGIITTGLNHLAHAGANAFSKHRFNVEIERAFKNPDAALKGDFSDDKLLEVVKKIPTLNKLWNKFLKKFPNMKLEYDSKLHISDYGITQYTDDDKVYGVKIYRNFMEEGYRSLSHVILHEFGHVNSAYHGFIFKNAEIYGRGTKTPGWIDEIYAHKFANFHGGSTLNRQQYKDAVYDLSHRPAGAIKADDIKLPTFD